MAFRDVPAALENPPSTPRSWRTLTTINEDNGLVKVLSEDFIDGFVSTFVYMGEPMLNKPDAARGFLRAYCVRARFAGQLHEQEIATIIEKYTQVPANVALRSLAPQYDPNGRIPIENLKTLQEYFPAKGCT